MKCYDLAIIGSGPGGYVTAIYAARHNLKVCVIEKDLLGGTCLNKGCIPTKSLLNSVSTVSVIKEAAKRGFTIDGYKIDLEKMVSRKDEAVSRLRAGVETLFRANKIDLIRGFAKLLSSDTVAVTGNENISAKNIIIASGSRVSGLPNIKIDDIDVLSSESILNLKAIPKSLIIIGGGVIGCEFACLFSDLGVKVTVVEMTDRLLQGQSREVSKKLEFIFKKKGIDVRTSSTVESVNVSGSVKAKIAVSDIVEAEKVLISTGRISNTDEMGLEGVGIKVSKGKICVDDYLRTDVSNIYAIGDCIPGAQLAHKASYDGILACDNILGVERRIDYSNIPNCIWTSPEVASVGLSEEAAKAAFPNAKIAKFPYLASGKAFIEGEVDGFVKIIGTVPGGDILGVEIFGKDACNLIGEATLAKTRGISIKDWSMVVHGHPTLSEVLQEACHIFCGTPIHSI